MSATRIVAVALVCMGATLFLFSVPQAGQQPLFTPAPGSPFAAGPHASDIAIADMNGDGAADLVVVADNGVSILEGDGRGGFRQSGSPHAITPPPHLVAVADFNGDRRLDLAVTSHDSNAVVVLLADGKGGFVPARGSPFAGYSDVKPHNHGIAVGDVNRDGKLDITLGHQEAGAIAVLLGKGDGQFVPAPESPFRIGRGFYPHALGDMNGDGKLDIVAPDLLAGRLVVALGDGKGGFTASAGSIAVKPRPYFVLLQDLNADRKLDIVATFDDISDVGVFLGDGAGRFRPAPGSPFDAGRRGSKTVAADLNGDGKLDLLIAGDGVMAFFGDGTGRFTAAPGSPYAAASGVWRLAAGDVNKDGKTDVAFTNSERGTVSVLLHR